MARQWPEEYREATWQLHCEGLSCPQIVRSLERGTELSKPATISVDTIRGWIKKLRKQRGAYNATTIPREDLPKRVDALEEGAIRLAEQVLATLRAEHRKGEVKRAEVVQMLKIVQHARAIADGAEPYTGQKQRAANGKVPSTEAGGVLEGMSRVDREPIVDHEPALA